MSGFAIDDYDLGVCQLRQFDKNEAAQVACKLAKIEPWLTLKTPEKAMADYFIKGERPSLPWGIVDGAEIMGIVCLKPDWLLGPYLDFLGLVPAAQGNGIGRAVINWLEAEAIKSNARNIFLCVSGFNKDAQGFYKAMGFMQCVQLDGLIVNEYAEILMRKRLS